MVEQEERSAGRGCIAQSFLSSPFQRAGERETARNDNADKDGHLHLNLDPDPELRKVLDPLADDPLDLVPHVALERPSEQRK